MIKKFFHYLLDCLETGFYTICLVLSNGFFFYFYIISLFFEKVFKLSIFKKGTNFFKNKQKDPVAFLMIVLVLFIGIFLHTYLYVDNTEIKYVYEEILKDVTDEEKSTVQEKTIESDKETYTSNEINLYRKFGKMNINSISFDELKSEYSNVVAWIMVDGTNVNYPIVQTTDNDFYLNHDITKQPKGSGWTFMDYRNSVNLDDSNTIFYGHNLLNKTAFGSLSNVFTDKWFQNSNHYIVVRTPNGKHVYQVFSCYYIDSEVYYLQTNFYNNNDYQVFLDTLKGRSNYNFGLDVTTSDKIITLSTCTDDNKGRKVIHAKMVE